MNDETLLSDANINIDTSDVASELNTLQTSAETAETITYYENMLSLELAQTSLLIVIFITVLLSGIYKIGR